MRKVVLALALSLDGYVARENGNVDWLQMSDLTEAQINPELIDVKTRKSGSVQVTYRVK